jgi:hypothetical protein
MEIERLQDLSINYWLRSLLPSFVSVVDAFPANINQADTPLTLPTVSVDSIKVQAVALELGGLEINDRMWVIDIFAKTKSQRDDFTYLLVNTLKSNIPVYDYNQGFPPAIVPCIGGLVVDNIQARPVYVFQELVKDLYWRSSITFSTKYQSYI